MICGDIETDAEIIEKHQYIKEARQPNLKAKRLLCNVVQPS